MHVVILGNGVAGVSAALRIRQRRPDWRITMISGESRYHWSRPALMYVFMGHMRYRDTKPFEDSSWRDKRIDLVRGWVARVDEKAGRVDLHDGRTIAWDRLLVATGSTSNRFGWPGQDLDGVQGLYGLYDLHRLYRTAERTRHAVIVGGGLIGIELAEMLHARNIHVTFFVREPSYWSNVLPREESAMVNALIREQGIDLHLDTELASIEDDGRGRCTAAVTRDGRRVECQLVGLTAGVSPNVGFLAGSGIETGRGVMVDRTLRSSADGVWAAGDCAEIVTPGEGRNVVEQVWYTGKRQGEVAGENIAGSETAYRSGIWFNSAKFLDLEYQVYGRVHRRVEGEHNLYWQHPGGRHAARVVYTDDGVIGFQTMGIRWRHVVAERWIRERRPIDSVVEQLGELAFDAELGAGHEAEVARTFQEQMG